jgi:hypothetical protein
VEKIVLCSNKINIISQTSKLYDVYVFENDLNWRREKCVGTVKAKAGEEATLDKFWASNHYVAGKIFFPPLFLTLKERDTPPMTINFTIMYKVKLAKHIRYLISDLNYFFLRHQFATFVSYPF